MKECCANCQFYLNLEKWDYRYGGCQHTPQEGYVCMSSADEGVAIWMIGCDENKAHCEIFMEKKK